MLSGFLALLLVLSLTGLSSASPCPRGKQYLETNLQQCINCTLCDREKGLVVLRSCDVHKDTLCGPIEKLKILMEHPHRRRHDRHKEKHPRRYEDNSHEKLGENAAELRDATFRVGGSEAPFSNAETLMYDWQDITLIMGVLACIVFFLVITLYSLHQAKQWRKLKENFDAGELI